MENQISPVPGAKPAAPPTSSPTRLPLATAANINEQPELSPNDDEFFGIRSNFKEIFRQMHRPRQEATPVAPPVPQPKSPTPPLAPVSTHQRLA